MTTKRKTIEVSKVLEDANRQLRRTDLSDETRLAIAMMLERVLFSTGNYKGFNYVAWVDEGGCQRWRADQERAGTEIDNTPYLGNQTRRVYY